MELRQKTNGELFALYEGELAFHHRSARGIHEAKRVLNLFYNYLGEFPPTPELAKSYLSAFKEHKPTTIARYVAILKVFFKWYGEELDIKIRVPKILPSYVEKTDIEKLLEAMKSKRSHKESVLGTKEELAFKPMVKLGEGSYLLICKYKSINYVQANQTTLSFRVKKASRIGEIYVMEEKFEFINLIHN